MIMCKNCGAILPEDSRFCTECGTPINESAGSESTQQIPRPEKRIPVSPRRDSSDTPDIPRFSNDRPQQRGKAEEAAAGMVSGFKDAISEMTKASDPINIRLAEGEVIVREYEAARQKFFLPSTNGTLIVTNKRVIFYSGAAGSRISSSVPIQSAGVITVFNGSVANPVFVVIALVGMFLFFTNLGRYGNGGMVFLGLVMTIVGIFLMNVPTMYLSIGSTNSSPGMVIGKPNIIGSALYAINGYGGKDIDLIMNELGALILDLQQMGDQALKKWSA